ncbi:hypothetical protein EJP69_00395 [Variovorax gossypii]|uniref:Phage coat protein n=1 Tax=Variovorax gossypii TaxID=1679495 RepID=A0A3S0J2T5_9BURK|nr:hypothetical protein [Variovorax gossypii]RTQ36253.1 hypothetical protein EJP69_00395 [Variovorax gossypii]
MNKRFRFAHKAAAAVAAAGASAAALAADPTTALEGFQTASAASSGFGPGMWGLAAATVGILIGVKWIKRGRGAA